MPLAVVATAVNRSWSSATNVDATALRSDDEDEDAEADDSAGAGGGDRVPLLCAALADDEDEADADAAADWPTFSPPDDEDNDKEDAGATFLLAARSTARILPSKSLIGTASTHRKAASASVLVSMRQSRCVSAIRMARPLSATCVRASVCVCVCVCVRPRNTGREDGRTIRYCEYEGCEFYFPA
jgi:hypothetical protein